MSDAPLILAVAVPSPLYRSFDYLPPADHQGAPPVPGVRVSVPFGRREVVGVLMAVRQHTDVARAKLKPALEILDHAPVFDAKLLQLLEWAAGYYHHPIGDVVSTALPVLLRKPGSRAQTQIEVWTLTEQGRAHNPQEQGRAARQARVMMQLQQQPGGLARDALDAPLSVLRTLRDKGWIRSEVLSRDTRPGAVGGDSGSAHALSDAQQQAVDAVKSAFGNFQALLLDGVTGSGKTEVYLHLIEPLLAEGRQVLVLVPEIGLTPQLVDRFQRRFGVAIAVMHSGLNETQRLHAWQQAAAGRAPLVLGTRSAIFTPLARPGLIIVDEEHDPSLKQQEGFRYSARDLAVWRARQLNIPVLLGSATPSLESLFNVQQGRYRHLHLPERAGAAAPPAMRLLDLRNQPMRDLLSRPLIDAMSWHLARDGQVLLFLNRRGFAPVLLCHACGWVAECSRCDARMTLHQRSGALRCHHCGSQRRIDVSCPTCGGSKLIGIGEGTERIEEVLLERFPEHRVLRIDRDTTRRKGQLDDALDEARSGRAHILLGTQMLAKGHHFPGVSLAAILDADQGLFSADFRASERMAQLIIQVAGRAGRAEKPGEVIIQTHQPDHPLLHQLVGQGYAAFAEAALQERCETLLPPFASLAILRAEAPQAQAPQAFLEAARAAAGPLAGEQVQIWGPVAAPMERRAGRYRAQLLFQAQERVALQGLLSALMPQLEQSKSARRVRWSIDVDPVDTF
ncbi:MAG: primosomal protein N' [Thiogranum sp.]|nr:primosomal protein N' [Thiogranum sp.]